MTLRRPLTVALIGATVAALASAAPADRSSTTVPDVRVSRQLMEREGLSLGELVTLATDSKGGNPHVFRVVGQYEPTPDPMRLGAARLEVQMHLPDVIDLTSDSPSLNRQT